jgi:hypothetical protein
MRITKRTAALAVVAATVFSAGAYAWAESQPQDPQITTPQQQAQQQAQQATPQHERPRLRQWARRHPGQAALLHRAAHADLVVKDRSGAWVTVQYDRGTLKATGDHSLTIERPDGKTVTVKVDDATRYRGIDGFAEVQTGEPLIVVAKDGVATVVAQRTGNAGVRADVDATEGQVPAT